MRPRQERQRQRDDNDKQMAESAVLHTEAGYGRQRPEAGTIHRSHQRISGGGPGTGGRGPGAGG